MRMLDLYSGLGGASEAFLSAGWDVLRIDNNPLLSGVPNTVMNDLSSGGWNDKDKFDLVWASPPCREFSSAYSAPGPKAKREGRDFEPDLTLLNQAMLIINTINPRWWVIENVSGASKIFSRELGMPPRQIVGPFFLWGLFPRLIMPPGWNHSKFDNDTWSDDPLRPNKRGKIPLGVSEKLLQAISEQRSLEDYI